MTTGPELQPPPSRVEPDPPEGDERSPRFHEIYTAYYADVYAYVVRRLPGSPEDAADLTAETFATVWRRLDQLPRRPEDRLWIYGVARRVLSRHRRGMGRRARLLVRLRSEVDRNRAVEGPSERTITDRERVQLAIGRLRPSDRDVLGLVLWERLSHAEAARILGCSVNAVGLRVHKARARLRRELGHGGAQPPDRLHPPTTRPNPTEGP